MRGGEGTGLLRTLPDDRCGLSAGPGVRLGIGLNGGLGTVLGGDRRAGPGTGGPGMAPPFPARWVNSTGAGAPKSTARATLRHGPGQVRHRIPGQHLHDPPHRANTTGVHHAEPMDRRAE
ncbi:hypothetical protein A5N15_04060 [Rothia kristinae]|uniref:Uncharacterized protein n=1 Tax=Rothia kristinae TaxID=37923 RepID=A0A657IV14_9MICC|nr:hypothetical protein A5N15_04060 [Rothia kristinae]